MSATVKIYRYNGSGPSSTDITGINTRVDGSDNVSTGETTNPVPIPASGTNYSFWCATQLYCTVGPATQINNIQWYTSGTNNLGTGVGCNVGQATAYTQATGSGGIGTQLTTGNYSSLTGPRPTPSPTPRAPLWPCPARRGPPALSATSSSTSSPSAAAPAPAPPANRPTPGNTTSIEIRQNIHCLASTRSGALPAAIWSAAARRRFLFLARNRKER